MNLLKHHGDSHLGVSLNVGARLIRSCGADNILFELWVHFFLVIFCGSGLLKLYMETMWVRRVCFLGLSMDKRWSRLFGNFTRFKVNVKCIRDSNVFLHSLHFIHLYKQITQNSSKAYAWDFYRDDFLSTQQWNLKAWKEGSWVASSALWNL